MILPVTLDAALYEFLRAVRWLASSAMGFPTHSISSPESSA